MHEHGHAARPRHAPTTQPEPGGRVDTGVTRQEIATVVHELRTPLTTVRGFLETLLAHGTDLDADAVAAALDAALRGTETLARRIDQLLTHERLADLVLDPQRHDLATVVDRVLADCAGLLADHDLRVDVVAGVDVEIDPDALAHVMGNLLANATRHSPAGSSIDVVGRRRDDDVHLSVRDRGRGIPEHELTRVFEPFFRGDHQDRRGAGLGLAIVRRYVDLSGGAVSVQSHPGRGTTVTVSLPVATAVEAAGRPRRPSPGGDVRCQPPGP